MGSLRLLGRAYVANRLLERRHRGRRAYGRSSGETASVTHEDFRERISRLRGSATTRAGFV